MARVLRLYTPDYKKPIDTDEEFAKIPFTKFSDEMLQLIYDAEGSTLVNQDAMIFKTKFGATHISNLASGTKALVLIAFSDKDNINLDDCGKNFIKKALDLSVECNKSIVAGESLIEIPTSFDVETIYINDKLYDDVMIAKYEALEHTEETMLEEG